MASLRFGENDRDAQGFVKVPALEPRSLADLLPTPQSIQADAQRVQKQPPTKAEWAAMIALAVLLIGIGAYLWSSGDARPALAPRVPATAPAATETRGDGSTAPSPIPAAAGRVLIAFAAPDGAPLGAIESTRLITPTAHYGDTWIQVDVAGSGLVWLRAVDVPELAITGPDLAPRPTRVPVAAPVIALPVATAPPPPPPCAESGVPGKMVRVCDYAELSELEARAKAQWIEQYGGNVGVIGTPSPQVREP